VIGEDLGTVPAGFRGRLRRAGIYGMSVLWFERAGKRFKQPADWPPEAAAMTSTHDLPTVAGWWRGSDLDEWARCGILQDLSEAKPARIKERNALWRTFVSAGVGEGDLPAQEDGARIADAAVEFITTTPSRLALLPLEDALASTEQPNLPGTIDQHPNWRRRYPGDAATLLDDPAVRQRVASLASRDSS
jgi:4-alpha-glucanotransferase